MKGSERKCRKLKEVKRRARALRSPEEDPDPPEGGAWKIWTLERGLDGNQLQQHWSAMEAAPEAPTGSLIRNKRIPLP